MVSSSRDRIWHECGEQHLREHTPLLVGLSPIETSKGLPTRMLKGALETTLEISEGEEMGPLYMGVLSVPGTKRSCKGVSRT